MTQLAQQQHRYEVVTVGPTGKKMVYRGQDGDDAETAFFDAVRRLRSKSSSYVALFHSSRRQPKLVEIKRFPLIEVGESKR
jgi:hypothetical protein